MAPLLQQPYPYHHKGADLFRNTALIFVVGFLFEYFLIPFQRTPSEHLYSYAVISLAHIGVATIVYFLYFACLSAFVVDEDWIVGKELLAFAGLLLFIGLGEWAIRDWIYDHPNNWALHIMWEEIWHAYLSGTVVFILVMTLNYNIRARKNLQAASLLHVPSIPNNQSSRDSITIETQTKTEDFSLDPSQLICAKADGNYTEFYVWENANMQKLIKRVPLSSVEQQLQPFAFIAKTHRAFLANTGHIERIEGNAQGYNLHFSELPFTVPVSRKNISRFNQLLA